MARCSFLPRVPPHYFRNGGGPSHDHESTGDGLASLSFGHQVVVVACPTYRAKQLLNDIRKDNRALKEVLPIGIAEADGTVTSLLGIPPLLVFAPVSVPWAIVEYDGQSDPTVLVDLEVASGGEAIVDEYRACRAG